MAIKQIRVPGGDSLLRKGFGHMASGFMHAMKANKKAGDHVEIVYDDGHVENYTLGDHKLEAGDAAFVLELHPGVEK